MAPQAACAEWWLVAFCGVANLHKTMHNPSRLTPSHSFKYQGRAFKLAKLREDRDAPWYTEFQLKGKRWHVSLETNVAKVAQERAIARIIEPGLAGREVLGSGASAPVPARVASIGELIAAYEVVRVGFVGDRAAADYIGALRRVVRLALGKPGLTDEEIGAMRTDILTPALVLDFEAAMLKRAAGDIEAEESAKRSVRTYYTAVCSLIREKWLPRYKATGLHLPEATLAEFRKARGNLETPAALDKQPQAPEVRAAVERLINRCLVDQPAHGALLLLGWCSLRLGEALRARVEWIHDWNGSARIVLPATTKGKRPRAVPISAQVASMLRAGAGADGFLVPMQAARNRHCRLVREVASMLRACGVDARKRFHELRAERARMEIGEHGPQVVQTLLGHSDIRTTMEHYAGRSLGGLVIDLPAAAA